MKMIKKKFLGILSLGLVLGLVLTACGGPGEDLVGLEKVRESKKLIVGTTPDYPPFEFIVDGEVVGLDASLAQHLAEEMGVELEIREMDFGNLLNGLSSGMIDLVLAGMNPTEENQKSASFSDIYYETSLGVIVRKDSQDILEEADLLGKKIGVQLGTTQAKYASGLDSEVVNLKSNLDIVMNIETEKLDGGIMEMVVAESFAKSNPDLKLVEGIDISTGSDGVAVASKKGNEDLIEEVNRILKEAKEEGLIDKWFLEAQELAEKTRD